MMWIIEMMMWCGCFSIHTLVAVALPYTCSGHFSPTLLGLKLLGVKKLQTNHVSQPGRVDYHRKGVSPASTHQHQDNKHDTLITAEQGSYRNKIRDIITCKPWTQNVLHWSASFCEWSGLRRLLCIVFI